MKLQLQLQQRIDAAVDTYLMTNSKAAAARSFMYPSAMRWQGYQRGFSVAPRNRPWLNADPLENSAVVNTMAWVNRNFGQAEFHICRQKRDGTPEPIINHPLQRIIERPNAFQTAQQLWAGTLFSYHLDGNAYWIKIRNARGAGIPTELWYEPHWSMRPHWPEDGSQFIDYYERLINGHIEQIDPRNVVHFRNGLNPANQRFGVAPLRAALLQIYQDAEVDAWIASLARNIAIPGVVVSPGQMIAMTPEKADQIKQRWKQRFGGDNRGEPLILDFDATVERLGFNPEEMAFTELHNHAESRIAGALGVPPALTYANVANQASTYNNMQTFERLGWEQCMIPAYEAFEDTIDTQLLIDFEQEPVARGIYTEFDTSHVRALKEDQKQKEDRIVARVSNGLMMVADAQAELGQTPDPQATYYLIPTKLKPITAEAALELASAPPLADPGNEPPAEGEEPKRLPLFKKKALKSRG